MKIKNHLSEECEHTVISRKYISIGREVKLKRKDMRAHEQDDKAHLNKALNSMLELKEKMAQFYKTIMIYSRIRKSMHAMENS